MRRNLIFYLVLAVFVISCKSKLVVFPLPAEIRIKCHDSLKLEQDANTHIGSITIFDSILIAEAFDLDTRQNPRLAVFNLRSKSRLGDFPWPDPIKSIYFGVALDSNALLYWNNFEYFRKINLSTRKIDTLWMKRPTLELVRMVVVNEKVYSLENIYGINIVDLKNTNSQIIKRPYDGYYYNEQNSISLPIDPALNLVASGKTDKQTFELYAVDTGMSIKWKKVIKLKDEYVKIQSFNLGDDFLIKYDNKLELVSKKDGATIWTNEFDNNIFDILKVNDKEVVVTLTARDDIANPPYSKKSILKFDISTRQIKWKDDSIVNCDLKYFNAGKTLFGCMDMHNWFSIDLATGKLDTVPFELDNNRFIEVVQSTSNGRRYLRYNGTIYW